MRAEVWGSMPRDSPSQGRVPRGECRVKDGSIEPQCSGFSFQLIFLRGVVTKSCDNVLSRTHTLVDLQDAYHVQTGGSFILVRGK